MSHQYHLLKKRNKQGLWSLRSIAVQLGEAEASSPQITASIQLVKGDMTKHGYLSSEMADGVVRPRVAWQKRKQAQSCQPC